MFYAEDGGVKMQIGQFSEKTGLTIDTLRYYNKIELLIPQKIGSRWCYTEEDVKKADIIKKLKNLYFTLDEIKMLFVLDKDTDEENILSNENIEKINCSLNMIKGKYKDIERREKDLVQVKTVLGRMIDKTNRLLKSGFPKQDGDEIPENGKIRNSWNSIFSKIGEFDIHNITLNSELEKALDWACEGTSNILDFGCGNSKVLFKCIGKGVQNIAGVDLSDTAIKTGKSIAAKHNLESRCNFICGDIDALNSFEDNSFDSAILFNIVDNLYPEDAVRLMDEMHRILKNGSRILIKLNPYFNEEVLLESGEYKKIKDNLFIEDSGLIINNLSDEELYKFTHKKLKIVKNQKLIFEGQKFVHRLFYGIIEKQEMI